MKKKEVYKLFKELNISKKVFPKYSDPYTFAREIEKVSILKFDEVRYSIGTGCLRKEDNA